MDATFPLVDPGTTALLLMDFQPAVLFGLEATDTEVLLDRAVSALAWARSNGVTVAHVRVAFQPADFAAVSSRNRTFSALKPGGPLDDGSPECEIVDALKPQPNDIVVRKTRFGAFSTTDLHQNLRSSGVQHLVLAGVTTGGVVLSTVRDAADKDFGVFVLADACADGDKAVHGVLIDKVFPQQAYVISTAQLAELH